MGRLLDVRQSTVWEWLNGAEPRRIPAEHVLKVEAATRVSRSDLRPDLYPRGLQDGVPFVADPLEGPLAPSPDERADERSGKMQAAAAGAAR